MRDHGVVGPHRWSGALPAVRVDAAAHAVRSLAREPSVVSVLPSYPGQGINLQATDPVSFANIDVSFNAASYFGGDQRVGVIEADQYQPGLGPCSIFDSHDAFAYTGVIHQAPPVPCSNFLDCLGNCNFCSAGFCSAPHATQVASVISASDHTRGRRSAGQAAIYHPNDQSPCDPSDIESTYEWLVSNDVFTTNESYGCLAPYETSGIVQDWYADEYGVTVVRAAGNGGEDTNTNCNTLYNGICVGAATESLEMSCFSSYVNPPLTDREEPDVAALGGDSSVCASSNEFVRVAHPDTADEWVGNHGTSFAAPAITAMILLMRERCSQRWPFMDQKLVRAIVRNSAYSANVDGGLRYSTPFPGYDFADGGGWLSAASLFRFCGSGGGPGPDVDAGIDEVDLNDGEPLPSGMVHYDPEEPREEVDEPAPLSYDLPEVGRVGRLMGTVELEAGNRIRYSVSWDSHYDGLGGTRQPTVDFDLFLYNATTGAWIVGSQSVNDVNEGFDVVIDSHEEGEYEIWLGWPNGESEMESLAWASAIWK